MARGRIPFLSSFTEVDSWRIGTLQGIAPACAALAEYGLAVWNVEYRRVGNEGGGWPGTWQDLASAADMLRKLKAQHELDLNRVVTLGHSAGTSLAFWLAARHRVRPEQRRLS